MSGVTISYRELLKIPGYFRDYSLTLMVKEL
jgi:hypothetical protein